MFIAHLPFGYVLAKKLQKKFKIKKYLYLGLFASILPDFDILYFYFVDNRQHLHHSYWIHLPFYWFLIYIFVSVLLFLTKKDYFTASQFFFANIFFHILLDSVVGKVEWFYPLSEKAYYFFDVPVKYNFWIYNFVFHWTFLLEIGIFFWALIYFIKCKKLNN